MMIFKRFRVRNLVDDNIYYPVGDGDHGSIKPEMYQENGIPYIRVQNLNWNGQISLKGMVFISDDVNNANSKSILKPNDILIAKTGATIGKLGLITDEIGIANTTSSVGKVTVDSSRFSPKYILYCFQSKNFNDQLWLEASQKSAQPGFNIDNLVDFEIFAPERLADQVSIAEYLDKKTTEIDTIIAKKEQLLELLEEKKKAIINEVVTKGLNPNTTMKNSGIEWIGEIPEHWEIVQLKYLTIKVGSGVTPKGGAEVYSDDGIKFIRSQNVYFEGLRLADVVFIDEKIHNQMENSKVNLNDVLLNITGGSIGRSCIVNIESEFNVNQHVCIIRPNEKLLPEFLNFALFSNLGQTQIRLGITGGNREGLNFENIKNFYIPNISIKEQEEIVGYLNIKNDELNLISTKISTQISKLKEYRQSLISEAVTGKIDI
ncbi:restriction endonuclease subunit S [Chryseobacterium arthrosphaerae]|uniref:restriction endonuclease subunit S n=1 Tax=Chryseobacterium arthrosphaerae TaxID=651561 RepID=UPI001BAF1A88|nr:restriction endonuclease subunit S [Chryseobacterium arthrosphaerae]QUY53878.1 restriction endonuclease subunit S [Chryseobacterium arthrosphaerae]